MTWTDPVTGLTSGPIEEPAHPLRCQHCQKRLRALSEWTCVDEEGFCYCQKDLPHQPMPEVTR